MLQQQQCLQQQQQHRISIAKATSRLSKTSSSNNTENKIFPAAIRKNRENVVGARITAQQHVAATLVEARNLPTATTTKIKPISNTAAATFSTTTAATTKRAAATSTKLLNNTNNNRRQVFLTLKPKQNYKNAQNIASNILPQHSVDQSSMRNAATVRNTNTNNNNDNNINAKKIETTESAAKSADFATMLPATSPPPPSSLTATTYTNSNNNKSDEKTIDFNSRRRRGRLRQPSDVATAENCRWSPATLAAVLAAYAKNVAYRLKLLLTSLLLSFLVAYVNITKKLLLSTTGAAAAATAARTTISHSPHNPDSNDDACSDSVTASSVALVAATRTKIYTKSCFARPKLSAFYAFILSTSLILPGGINFAAAAKPKSATQLKQHLQQQHQQQQHQHQQQQEQQQQPQPVAAGDDSVVFEGGVLRTPPSYQVVSSNEQSEFLYPSSQSEEMFDEEESEQWPPSISEDGDQRNANLESKHDSKNVTNYANVTEVKTPLFPADLFSKYQLENGAVAFHIVGVIYMFVALAIVCDEFFVPSLDVIIEKLGITDDVAGATFMAAGGSAPELFTSVIGVFVSFDDVGIGTIVGSAVFNILFVIGMCALFSKTVLTLTWWPLFRDCTFYSISLITLIAFFRDNLIYWWEALILFSIYIAYVGFMKWNVQVERCVKKLITKNKVTRVRSTDQLMPAGNAANSSETSMATQPGGSVTSRAASETRSGPPGSSSGAGATGNSSGSTQTGAKFRHGLLQLMIHTIDPLHDDDVPGKVDEKATQLHAIASLKVLLDATKPQRGGATTSAANHVKINLKETTLADRPNGNIDTTLDSPSLSGRRPSWIEQRVKIQTRKFSIKTHEIEDEPEPLSMAWPDTARKRLTYILVAPLLIPMWLTLPDTRTPRGKKYYPVTFIGSIVWIAAFSYLMVWWANVAGDTARIPPEVMGLTFLAAGTSIPDLITSVIVARKGFGDMAVSSSVGSNIFDVTVGLPIPWLIYGLIYGAPVEVNSVGMVCSITILFMMLIFVVMSIACFRWRMNKGLGFTMFLLYFAFVAVSLMFEYDFINCPV